MPANPYDFTPTEFVSEGGYGSVRIKLHARGWVVSVWSRDLGYESIAGDASATLADALTVYEEWIASRLAGEVEF